MNKETRERLKGAKIVDITPPSEEDRQWMEFLTDLKALAERMPPQPKPIFWLPDEKRQSEMKTAYNLLRGIISEYDPDATFEFRTRERAQDIGVIEIHTYDFGANTLQMPDYKEAINLADNIEIMAMTDGKVLCTLSFNGIMKGVGGRK